MKILLCIDTHEHQLNGVANSVNVLAREYREMGHDVRILKLSSTHRSHSENDNYFLASAGAPVYPDARFSLHFFDRLVDSLIEWKPDIVHIHTEFSINMIARRIVKAAKAPLVMTLHTDYVRFVDAAIHSKIVARLFVRIMSTFSYHGASILTVPSEKTREMTHEYTLNCPVVVVPGGIELDCYQKPVSAEEKAALYQQYGITHPEKLLVTVSRISAEKNISELISFMPGLLKKDPDIRFMITGYGPAEDDLKKQVSDLGLKGKVIFTGKQEPEEVYRFYKAGAVFVCASEFETQGLTYIEAMACSLPLVCRKDPVLKNMIFEGKNGYTYTTEHEYAEHILKLLNNPALRDHMGKVSLKVAAHLSGAGYARKMEKVYKILLGKKK
ncbi:MAG: glycosyltransferase [Lachnospiraceae bacterium]|nr:glycosyltransferase [Lachnospiraceae bacterium]